jgi:hypothetical protein
VLQKHEAENPAFNKFVDMTMQHPKMRGLKLFAFLIKPCQRLLKYPLLLRELVKCTSEDHPDRERLVLALKKFEEVRDQHRRTDELVYSSSHSSLSFRLPLK